MQNIALAVERMNALGKASIPFFFLIDYEMKMPEVLLPEEAAAKGIFYSLEGSGNVLSKPVVSELLPEIYSEPECFASYSVLFEKLREEIQGGNTYLCNLTVRTPVRMNIVPEEIFFKIHSKYKILFRDHFLCFSPETFIRIHDGKIFSFPMKGTIDAAVPDALQTIMEDEKEVAEHYTIVDLIRNDLGLVAENIRVERFRYVDRVHTRNRDLLQVSSEISGDLPADYAARIGNIIVALLPAGSISGAPKKKTVEILQETEGQERGFFTGVAGFFDGRDLNSCVLIRFIEKLGGRYFYRSGGGITCFSDAEKEYREMLEKIYIPQ